MPSLRIINLVEAYTEQVLVNLQDGRNDHRHREVLLNERIIQRKGLLKIQAVIITIIPYVEFAIEGLSLGLEILGFKLKERFALLRSQRA